MRNKLKKSSRPSSISSTKSSNSTPQTGVGTDTTHTRAPSASDGQTRKSLDQAPQASNAPSKAMSSSHGPAREHKPPPSTSVTNSVSRKLSTIRAVTSFDEKPRPSSEEEASPDSSPSAARDSAFSSSINSTTSARSSTSQSQQSGPKSPSRSKASALSRSATPPLQRSKSPSSLSVPSGHKARSRSRSRSRSRLGAVTPQRDRSREAASERTITEQLSFGSPPQGAAMADDGAGTNGWDSTVGKAGLGKTGRVINRLVSENETLKRDLKIERLKADEARQSARLLEDKMDRMVSEYESRLLEASVTKTLLLRKERQVESLQGAVELEKKRTTDAKDRERVWRDEMEKIKKDSKRQVEEATSHAALMEGRYNAISSHWRDQGEMVKQAASRMGKDIGELVDARRQDDDKIQTLRDLCDQQDCNIRLLLQQKEDIARKFEEYKQEQEDALRDIKANAAEREAQQTKTLEESREVLDKLKWALNVKKTIEWAE